MRRGKNEKEKKFSVQKKVDTFEKEIAQLLQDPANISENISEEVLNRLFSDVETVLLRESKYQVVYSPARVVGTLLLIKVASMGILSN